MAIEVGVASRKVVDTVSRQRIFRDAFEIGVVALAFLFYFLVRGSVVQRDAEALRNAVNIIDIERTLGFFWEPGTVKKDDMVARPGRTGLLASRPASACKFV